MVGPKTQVVLSAGQWRFWHARLIMPWHRWPRNGAIKT
jgi:hypothetical protein